ncbi:hypothetical protein HDU67_002486 [Dinochytrium kinnereticum]|nr:hypothetical protein HDU67_002486 [Dinochytrium kinnereticum]
MTDGERGARDMTGNPGSDCERLNRWTAHKYPDNPSPQAASSSILDRRENGSHKLPPISAKPPNPTNATSSSSSYEAVWEPPTSVQENPINPQVPIPMKSLSTDIPVTAVSGTEPIRATTSIVVEVVNLLTNMMGFAILFVGTASLMAWACFAAVEAVMEWNKYGGGDDLRGALDVTSVSLVAYSILLEGSSACLITVKFVSR